MVGPQILVLGRPSNNPWYLNSANSESVRRLENAWTFKKTLGPLTYGTGKVFPAWFLFSFELHQATALLWWVSRPIQNPAVEAEFSVALSCWSRNWPTNLWNSVNVFQDNSRYSRYFCGYLSRISLKKNQDVSRISSASSVAAASSLRPNCMRNKWVIACQENEINSNQ